MRALSQPPGGGSIQHDEKEIWGKQIETMASMGTVALGTVQHGPLNHANFIFNAEILWCHLHAEGQPKSPCTNQQKHFFFCYNCTMKKLANKIISMQFK
jgi:hypothetical protein